VLAVDEKHLEDVTEEARPGAVGVAQLRDGLIEVGEHGASDASLRAVRNASRCAAGAGRASTPSAPACRAPVEAYGDQPHARAEVGVGRIARSSPCSTAKLTGQPAASVQVV